MIAVFLLTFVPLALVVMLIGVFTQRLARDHRIALVVLGATLLLTPAPGPATIVVVPVPLGLLLGGAVFTGSWMELASLIRSFPVWFAAAILITAGVSYFVARKLLSNTSLERTREG